jgi:hypothetical protein
MAASARREEPVVDDIYEPRPLVPVDHDRVESFGDEHSLDHRIGGT